MKRHNGLLLRKRRCACNTRAVVASQKRRHSESHDGVADIFVDYPAMAVDDLGERTEIFVEEMHDGAGSKLLTDAREMFDVRKKIVTLRRSA